MSNKLTKRQLLAIGAVAFGTATSAVAQVSATDTATPASAQMSSKVATAQVSSKSAPPPPASAKVSSKKDVRDLQGVTVTAEKRVERLQDVPVAVTAISADQLDTLHINSPMALRYVAPSLNFQDSVNARGEGFAIRGVGTAVFSDTVEQSVGVVVDGVPLANPGQALADLIDVDQVEVLRGPQGMLFGKNASAGVISITTKAPEFANTLQTGISYASKDEVKANVIGNLKLNDTMAFRIAYSQTSRDGIIDNIYRHELLNGRDSKGVRTQLLWDPTSNWTVNLFADWNKSNQRCCAWTVRTAPATSLFGQLNEALGITPGPENLKMASAGPFYMNADNWGTSLKLEYDGDWATFTSISAYRLSKTSDNNSPAIIPINFLYINSGQNRLDQASQEFRLTSPSDGKFDWLVGTFMSHINNHGITDIAGNFGQTHPGTNVYYGSITDGTTTNKSAAVYGQMSYKLTDKLKWIFGSRYTSESVDYAGTKYTQPTSVVGFPGQFIGPVSGHASANNLSGRVALQYSFDNDLMVYASVARGYKGPGINTQGITSSNLTTLKPEISTSYEIGLRSQFLDRRVTLNVTGFETNFRNFQASIFDVNLVPAQFIFSNAGMLRTRGVEADFQARSQSGLTFNASATYANSTYANFRNITCYPGQTVLPLGTPRTSPRQCILITPTQSVTYGDGNPLSNAPKLTYTATVGYGHTFGEYRIDSSLNWFWRSRVSFDPAGNPLMTQGAYGLLNANIGIGPDNGKWQLSFFARNILNKYFVGRVTTQGVYGGPGITVQWPSADAERSVGVALDVNFGGI